jgi:hypothetical protein
MTIRRSEEIEEEMFALLKLTNPEAKLGGVARGVDAIITSKDGHPILIECKHNGVYIEDSEHAALVEHIQNARIIHVSDNHNTRGLDVVKKALVKPVPGENLSRLARLSMSAEAHGRFVWPAIQDLRIEYEDIKKSRGPIQARCVLMRGYASVVPHWLYGLVAHVIKWVVSA